MKPLFLPLLLLIGIATWSLLPMGNLNGQTGAEPAVDLNIQNIKHPKRSVVVKAGRKVKVFLNDERTYKGVLQKASTDSLQVDTLSFAYNDIRMVRVPGFGSIGAKASGMVMGLIGFGGFLLGLVMVLIGLQARNPDNTSDGCAQLLFVIAMILLGAVIGLFGSILFVLGLIAVIIGVLVGKAFKLDGKWRLGR
jgi:hypothetical protein